MNVYPMKFEPILKEKIWGGNKLKTLFNKKATSENIGESWEISGLQDNVSKIVNGVYAGKSLNFILSNYKESFLGVENFERFGENFPLLIKFLDAKTNLSVQVHPDDRMAAKNHNSFGKTEMWYIMENDVDAEIVLGLKDKNFDVKGLDSINDESVFEVFNTEKVTRGDSYFIPAGKIHAIGAGVLAAEIQQTSDITYRVYDWDREDEKGNRRELHTELAIEATKMFKSNGKKSITLENNRSENLAECEYFTTNIVDLKGKHIRNYSRLDSFVIFMCIEGKGAITVDYHSEKMNTGDTILIPANSEKVIFKGENAKFLEVYISRTNANYLELTS